jgi:hypothetical protein
MPGTASLLNLITITIFWFACHTSRFKTAHHPFDFYSYGKRLTQNIFSQIIIIRSLLRGDAYIAAAPRE